MIDIGRYRAKTRLFNRARKVLKNTHCMKCEYDEAEGDLLNHCHSCLRKIVSDMWCAFLLSSDAQHAAAKPRLRPNKVIER